jgi:hypothetical protein
LGPCKRIGAAIFNSYNNIPLGGRPLQPSELTKGAYAPTIHDPLARATQSQIDGAIARKERLERIRAAATRPLLVLVAQPVPIPDGPIPDEEMREAHRIIESPETVIESPETVSEEPPPIPRTPRIEDIQRAVAKEYGVTRLDMISARRWLRIVRPRQIAMYIAKSMTLRSLPEIGRRFGGRDHTTVLHAVRRIDMMKDKDPALAEAIERIKQRALDACSLRSVT